MANDINNSTARIWTKSEMRESLKQAKAYHFEITKGDSTLTIVEPNTKDTVLSGILMNNRWLVRIDQSYFGD
jgi:hypothetical protein